MRVLAPGGGVKKGGGVGGALGASYRRQDLLGATICSGVLIRVAHLRARDLQGNER